jgi:antitoxin ParD1/3/4
MIRDEAETGFFYDNAAFEPLIKVKNPVSLVSMRPRLSIINLRFFRKAETMQLPEERNRVLKQQRLVELRQKIASGTEQIAQGKVTEGELVFARLQEKCTQFLSLDQE